MIKPPTSISYNKTGFLSVLLLLMAQNVFGQTSFPIEFLAEPKGVFSFTKHWDYPNYITKDSNGKFHSDEANSITKTDTAHLYFTANCETNIQGGYKVRYCKATKNQGQINLHFADGLPAYGSSFDVTISNGTFIFTPHVRYPMLIKGEVLVYQVTHSKLVLYQPDPYDRETIKGYIDVDFTEKYSNTLNTKKQTTNFYFRGYFKSPLN